jgi:tetratricopeptide (TPR) repeat protein
VYKALGKTEEAAHSYSKVIELDEEHAEARYHRAKVLSLLGQTRHAIKEAQHSALLHEKQGNVYGAKKAHALKKHVEKQLK